MFLASNFVLDGYLPDYSYNAASLMFLASNFVLDGYLPDYSYNAASLIFIAVDKCLPTTINELARKGAKISSGILQIDEFNSANFIDYGSGSILMRVIQTKSDEDVTIIKCLLNLGADPNKFIRCRIKDLREQGSVTYAQCHTALS